MLSDLATAMSTCRRMVVSSLAKSFVGSVSISLTAVTATLFVVVPLTAELSIVSVTVRVSVAPDGRSPIVQTPVPKAKAVVPLVVAELNVQPVGNDAINASVRTTPVAAAGPLLVAVIVYVRLSAPLPAIMGSKLSDFATSISTVPKTPKSSEKLVLLSVSPSLTGSP